MRLLTRIRDLLNASLNDLLDGLEKPELMLNQLIRDLDSSILELRREIVTTLTQRNLLQTRLDKAQADSARWQDNAALAVGQSRDDLARQALQHKHTALATSASLATQLAETDQAVVDLRTQLRALEDKAQEARRKRDTLLARQRGPSATRASDIIAGFDQLARYEEQLEQEIAVRDSAHAARASDLDSQFEQLRRQQTLDAELDALKRRTTT